MFRLYVLFPFLRPVNVIVNGKVKFDFFSFIEISAGSKLIIKNGMTLIKSRIRIKNSSLELGDNAAIKKSIFVISNSKGSIGRNMNVSDITVNLMNNSDFKAGDYLLIDGGRHALSGFYSNSSSVSLGDNVNLYAKVICSKGVFKINDNVFINEGTQIRCHHKIEMGSNIFISYECIIFDTNTHSLHHYDRREEIKKGFPNSTFQDDDLITKIKTAPISLSDDVWIGTRAIIFKGTSLGKAVIVGAASVVSGIDVPDEKKVLGNPAQIK